jgi:hypothetical protein
MERARQTGSVEDVAANCLAMFDSFSLVKGLA